MLQGNKIILVLGIVVIAAGIFFRHNSSSFQKKAVVTEGKVVYVLGSSYRIQYFTGDGTEKIYYGSGKTHEYHEGDSVKVWYNAQNPDRARFSDGRKGSRTLVIAGAFCVLMGIYPLFQKKKDFSASDGES